MFISSNCCWLTLIVHVLSVECDPNNSSSLNVFITKVIPCKILEILVVSFIVTKLPHLMESDFTLVCTRAATALYSERIESSETSCHPFPPTYILLPSSRMDLNIPNDLSVCQTKTLPAPVFISLSMRGTCFAIFRSL